MNDPRERVRSNDNGPTPPFVSRERFRRMTGLAAVIGLAWGFAMGVLLMGMIMLATSGG